MKVRSHLVILALLVFPISLALSTHSASGHLRDQPRTDPDSRTMLQKMPPSIMFATLLNNVTVNAKDGWFKLGNQIQNLFMPDGSTGTAVLSKVSGPEIVNWNWGLDSFGLKPPYKLFGFKTALKPDGSPYPIRDLKLTDPGKYTLDFFVDGKKFYAYPFTVAKFEPTDPFDGEAMYFTDGAWNDWGYLFYREADPENNLLWKIWLREKSFKTPSHKVKIEIVRDADRKVVCQNRTDATNTFRHQSVRYDFDMINPPVKTSGGGYFKAKDLLGVDGAYTLAMSIDGAAYGTWKFKVAGGKPVTVGRAERGKGDPLSFVEGGKDAFWYERVK